MCFEANGLSVYSSFFSISVRNLTRYTEGWNLPKNGYNLLKLSFYEIINSLMIQRILTPTFSFFLLLLLLLLLDDFFKTLPMFKLCLQHVTHVTCHKWHNMGVHRCALVCLSVWGSGGCAPVCAQVCVRNEFSEYLLETRFLTSANYSTHPLRIFFLTQLDQGLTQLSSKHFLLKFGLTQLSLRDF